MAFSYFNADFLKISFFTHFWIFWPRKWSDSSKNWHASSSEYCLKNVGKGFLIFEFFLILWPPAPSHGANKIKNGIFSIFACRKTGKNWKIKNPFPTFFRYYPRDVVYHFFRRFVPFSGSEYQKTCYFQGKKIPLRFI